MDSSCRTFREPRRGRNFWRAHVFVKRSPHLTFVHMRVPETPPLSDAGGVFVLASDTRIGGAEKSAKTLAPRRLFL